MLLYKKDDAAIIKHVTERFKELSDMRTEFDDMWLRYYKIYRSVMDDDYKKDVGANIFVPYVFGLVETVKPRIVTTMLAARPYIGLVAIDGDKQENAEILTNFIDYQLNHKMTFTLVTSNAVISALMYGTGITKQSWKFKEKKLKKRRPKIDPESGAMMGYEVVEEMVTVHDNPSVECIDIFDFYADPFIETIENQPNVIHRYFQSESEFKELLKKHDLDMGLLKKVTDGEGANADPTGVIRRLTENNIGTGRKKSGDIEILEYFSDDEWVIIANREIVVIAEENPFWHGEKPFAKLVDINVPGEFYGIGEIEPVEYLQHELNTMRNQRVDNVNIIINKMYSILRGANIDPEQLITRPGGFVEVDTHDDIQEIEFKDVTQNAYQEDSMVKADIDNTSGVFDYTKGASGTRRETATTATILSESSNERFRLKVQMFETTWLVEVGRQLVALNQQFIDSDRTAANTIEGKTMELFISPESIDGEFEYMAIGSSIEPVYNKAARQQVMMTLFQTLSPLPYINGKTLAKNLLKAYDVREIDSIIISDEQMPKIDGQGNEIDAMGNVTKSAQQAQAEQQAMMQQQQIQQQQQMAPAEQPTMSREEVLAVIDELPPEVIDDIMTQLEQGQVPDGVPQEVIQELMAQLQGGQADVQ